MRNKALNARNFFAVDKPDLKQNQYGFTFGGPVDSQPDLLLRVVPGHANSGDRLLATALPPTAAERRGDFSLSARKPRDPVTNQPFPNAMIPATRFDGVAVKVMERYVPLPNSSDGRWVQLNSQPTDNDQYLFRIDHNFSQANSLNFRFFHDISDITTQAGNISPTRRTRSVSTLKIGPCMTPIPSAPRCLNEFHIGVNRVELRCEP